MGAQVRLKQQNATASSANVLDISRSRIEAPGKTRAPTNISNTGTVLSSTNLEDLTEEELERLLT